MNNTMNDALTAIAERAGTHIKREAGDYEKDGLLYCGKCNTPKQCKVALGNTVIKPPCLCACGELERDKRQQAEREAKHQRHIERLRVTGIKDEKLFNCTFENDKAKNKYSQLAKSYCNKWEKVKAENIGLIFYGDTGRGKSFFAACIANELINRGIGVVFRTESDLLDEIFDAPRKTEYIENIARIPLLIIDDFGTRRDTAYANEQFKKIIDKRYYSEKPTIFTTNLTPEDFNAKSIDDKRIFERVKAMGQFIEIRGKNWRQDEIEEKQKAIFDILNN